jgi:polysaccharide biosynthesis protein PelD
MADVASTPPAPAPGAPKMLFGLRQSAVIEITLFLGMALAIDLLFFDFTRFTDVKPHPFWAIVLLCAVQYGTSEALVAVAAASATLLIGNTPAQGFDEDLYAWLLRATLDPLLWAVAAVLFGELQGRMRRERDQLREDVAQSRRREDVIAAAYRRLDVRREGLEARVAGQLRTVFAIYNAAKGIERMAIDQIEAGVADLVRTVMAPRRYSLFLLRGETLVMAMNEGWEKKETRNAASFDGQSALFQAIVGSRRTLVAALAADDAVLRGEGLLAAPLLNVDTQEVIGMLKIEEMGFLDLTATTIENFRLLCEWIGTAYANAARAGRGADKS